MTTSGDPFSLYDAAYVLGALTPRDRREFEAHLSGCPACSAAVADLAGVPGLLGRARDEHVAEPPGPGAVPGTLLPRLIAASRAERRRGRLRLAVAGGLAAAAVALAAVLTAVQQATPPPDWGEVAMVAVRPAPVEAAVRLQRVAWGTKVTLRCTYIGAAAPHAAYDRVVYRLVAVARRDRSEQTVAQWAVLPGQDATVDGSTDLAPGQIGRLRLETADGTVLLEARPR